MPSLQFGISSYARARGDLPELPVVNMFGEEAPTETTGVVLQSRPGLDDRAADMGSGPVRELFQRDLVLNSALFGVSGKKLYRGTTLLGTVNGNGPFSMAGYQTALFVAGGEDCWIWNGSSLSAISFPDGASVAKVIVGASRAIVIRKDTGQFYWSDVLDGNFDSLDFATAENQPDRLLDMVFIDDTLVLGGAETIEYWPNTGDSELPFQPLEGRVIEKGIKATGCMIEFAGTFAAVTNANQVILGDESRILSNPGLEEKIEASAGCRLWKFPIGGVEFLALRLDEETQVWNLRSGLWSEFESKGETNWIAQCYAGGVFGSAVDGKTLEWSDGHVDLGGDLERRFRAGLALNSGGVGIANMLLRCNVGRTPFLTGDYTDPIVEMRVSRDGGQTWGAWKQTALGAQGDYRKKVTWRGLGMASQPGFLAEFRVTAPVPFRVSDVLVNESFGGR